MNPIIRIPVSKPSLTESERRNLLAAFDSCQLTYGPAGIGFESSLANLLGARHALTTSSGTTALHLALLALGIGPGDEVLVPNVSFVATANAVRYVGATPILVDILRDSWCISPPECLSKITKRTRAIVAVHLYGSPCEMSKLADLCKTHHLYLVEDAAEGLGGSYGGSPLGGIADVGTFSFYGNKIITTGEGGAVVTEEDHIAERVYLLRGQAMDFTRRYYHTEVGYNYRLTELQSAIGLAQLHRLFDMLVDRRAVFTRYREALANSGCTWPTTEGMAPWLFTLLLPPHVSRARVTEDLLLNGVDTRPIFIPMHRLPMYSSPLFSDSDFPVSSYVSDRGLSLPTYADLPLTDVDYVCLCLLDSIARQSH